MAWFGVFKRLLGFVCLGLWKIGVQLVGIGGTERIVRAVRHYHVSCNVHQLQCFLIC